MARMTAQEREAQHAAEMASREDERRNRIKTAPMRWLTIMALVNKLSEQGVHVNAYVKGLPPHYIDAEKNALRLLVVIDDRNHVDYVDEKLFYLDQEDWEYDALMQTLNNIQEKLDEAKREYELAKSVRDKLTPEELAAFKKHARSL